MSDVIEGKNPVYEAIKSGRIIHKILISRSKQKDGALIRIIRSAHAIKCPCQYVEETNLNSYSKTKNHQGVIALVTPQKIFTLKELLSKVKEKEKSLIVLLDGLEDPHNLGAIIRSSEVLGADALIHPKRRNVKVTSSVIKVAQGAQEYLPIIQINNLVSAMEEIKKHNYWIYGLDEDANNKLNNTDFTPKSALVIGSEGKGLSRLVKEKCDFLIKIPMFGKISSLNASVAAAITIYEYIRQKK